MSSIILHGLNQFESTNALFGGTKTAPAFADSTIGTARGIDICLVITFLVVGILGGGVGLTPAGAYALIGIGTIIGVPLIIKALYDRREALSRLCTCGGGDSTTELPGDVPNTNAAPPSNLSGDPQDTVG